MHNGWLVSGSIDQKIKVWRKVDYECIYTLEGHTNSVSSIKQLPNNDLVSISLDRRIIVWSFNESFKKVKEWDTGSDGYCLCIIDNDRIASGHADNIIRIWNHSTKELVAKLEGHSGRVSEIGRAHV